MSQEREKTPTPPTFTFWEDIAKQQKSPFSNSEALVHKSKGVIENFDLFERLSIKDQYWDFFRGTVLKRVIRYDTYRLSKLLNNPITERLSKTRFTGWAIEKLTKILEANQVFLKTVGQEKEKLRQGLNEKERTITYTLERAVNMFFAQFAQEGPTGDFTITATAEDLEKWAERWRKELTS